MEQKIKHIFISEELVVELHNPFMQRICKGYVDQKTRKLVVCSNPLGKGNTGGRCRRCAPKARWKDKK